MAIAGLGISIFCFFVLIISFVPLLGFINWINTPLALIGLVLSILGIFFTRLRKVSIIGVGIGILVISIGISRLLLGNTL
jgi:hypothetical protein